MAGKKKRQASRRPSDAGLNSSRTGAGKSIGLFVLGMHRSGTSAITRVINLLGADLGEKLMQAQTGVNDTGFWEHLEVVALHERLLRWQHSSWFDCRPIPPLERTALIQRTATAEAVGIIRADFPDSALWAIKDPRLCLFVPVWIQAAKALTSRIGFVIFIRNPDEVSASLARRDGITPGHAYLLWGKHVVESVRGSAGQPRAVGVYSRLLHDWRKEVDSIARKLSLEWPVPIEIAADEIERFLDVTRRHHVEAKQASDFKDPLHRIIQEIYQELLAIADGSDGWSALDPLFARFEDLAAATAPQIHNLLEHVMSHSDRADKAEHALARVVADIDGSGPVEAREQARQEAILAQIEQLKSSSAGAIETIASISQGQAQALAALPIQLSDIRESLDREVSEKQLELARLAELAGMRQASIDALLGQVESLSAEIVGLRAREAELAAAGTDRELVVASLKELVASQEHQLRELATRLAAEVESRTELETRLRNEMEGLENRWRSEAALRAQLEADLESSGKVIVRMDEDAKVLSEKIAEQTEIAARLELERDRLMGLLAERDGQIVSLAAAISAAEAEAVRQARQAAANDAEILSLSMQGQALETRLHHSQEVVAHRDGEIESILASASWKLTAPLRWIAGIWRKLFDV